MDTMLQTIKTYFKICNAVQSCLYAIPAEQSCMKITAPSAFFLGEV